MKTKETIFLKQLLLWVLFICVDETLQAQRDYGGFYTKERIENLRSNCDKFPWAAALRSQAVLVAKNWAAKDEEELWNMVPGQQLARCIDVTLDRKTTGPKFLGCLKCGSEISKYGNYPYQPDVVNKPWKLTCPHCGVVFPTNDFGKYYRSGINEYGLFDSAIADKSLLFNEQHPDPDDPLYTYGVDDGFGYVDSNGREHRFIGYYGWKYWDHIYKGLTALSNAYLYTGEQLYARKAAILLDRIADVYPSMDWKPYADRGWFHSDGGTNKGKIGGSIWETNAAQRFAECYDMILGGTIADTALYAFLKRQSKRYKLSEKGNRRLFVNNIDKNILHTIFDAVLSEQIRGNQGMHQLSVAKAALALNTQPVTNRWLDWLFEPDGGAIPGLMLGRFDRDGASDEGAPGYIFMWGSLIADLGELLRVYTDYKKHDIFRDFPQMRAAFTTACRMSLLGKAIPNIGDAGSTGAVSKGNCNAHFITRGFAIYRDTSLAIAAYRANGNSVNNLGLDIFAKDPGSIAKDIERIAQPAGSRPVKGQLMNGYGLAMLESGNEQSATGLAINFGRSIYHAHPDILNFDLLAFNRWLAPDHGYPEYATQWPSNQEWTGTTISHNLVVVDQQPQKEGWGGYTRLFKQLNGFGVVELDGKPAYPYLKEYSRTMFLIGDTGTSVNNTYLVDIFRVNGGNDHLYSFHGPPGFITTKGLSLERQDSGTYAGISIPKGAISKGFPKGYSHLYNIQRDNDPVARFFVDWKAETGYSGLKEEDDIHLRMHVLTTAHDVAIADGDPPQNKPGNPKSLQYLLMHRKGQALQSNFITVIEPYSQTPFIKSVERLPLDGDAVALKIEMTSGAVDHVFFNPSSKRILKLPGSIELNGRVGYLREKKGELKNAVLVDGKSLKKGTRQLTSGGSYKGIILKMNKELTGGGWVVTDIPLPVDGSLNGDQIIIQSNGERDATYTIEKVVREGNGSRVFCGPITFIRDFKGAKVRIRHAIVPKSYKEGFLYDFDEGASFTIHNHLVWNIQHP